MVPRTRICPFILDVSPRMEWRRVLLPQPTFPIQTRSLPGWSSKVTFYSAVVSSMSYSSNAVASTLLTLASSSSMGRRKPQLNDAFCILIIVGSFSVVFFVYVRLCRAKLLCSSILRTPAKRRKTAKKTE